MGRLAKRDDGTEVACLASVVYGAVVISLVHRAGLGRAPTMVQLTNRPNVARRVHTHALGVPPTSARLELGSDQIVRGTLCVVSRPPRGPSGLTDHGPLSSPLWA